MLLFSTEFVIDAAKLSYANVVAAASELKITKSALRLITYARRFPPGSVRFNDESTMTDYHFLVKASCKMNGLYLCNP